MNYKNYILLLLAITFSFLGAGNKGLTGLAIAARNGNLSKVKRYLERGFDINKVCKVKGYTPIMYAIKNDNGEVVEFLLSEGASVQLIGKDGETALSLAEKYAPDLSKSIEESLTTSDSGMEKSRSIPYLESDEILLKLREKNNRKNKAGWTPLAKAVADENLPQIIWLVETLGVDINTQNDKTGWTPLMKAAFDRKKNIVIYLLEHGADPTIKGRRGADVISLANSDYIPIDKDLIDILEFAVEFSKPRSGEELSEELLRLLKLNDNNKVRVFLGLKEIDFGYDSLSFIKNKIKINHRDMEDRTPLIISISNANRDLVEILLRSGANPHIAYDFYENAYQFAVAYNLSEIAILIDKYMDGKIKPQQ